MDYTTNVSAIDMSADGDKTLTVSYTKNGVTKTKDITIKVNAVPMTEYAITATAGANGSISPSGTVKVASGGSQTFTITPAMGYEIDTLKVDGSAVSSATSYTFSNVDKAHTIEATFKKKPTPEPTPEPTPTSYKIISGADSEWKHN